jgi:uncharacterized protein (TIGR03435 family)
MNGRLLIWMMLLGGVAAGQGTLAFETASVKPSARQVGPDYNNQITMLPSRFSARNATLRRLVAEAYGVQLRQVIGPGWLDENEYDIDARPAGSTDRRKTGFMLRALLADRFHLRQHADTREMRAYELLVDAGGPKIRPVGDGGEPSGGGSGVHFRGEMQRFADLLAMQFSIPAAMDPTQPSRGGGPAVPVLDKTGLTGVYDFVVAIKPELGVEPSTLWSRALREQLGLRIEPRRAPVDVIVVDDALRTPTAN